MRGVTYRRFLQISRRIFQLTRLMRGVTDFTDDFEIIDNISTHTPHARRDVFYEWYNKNLIKISTHTPHARRDALAL